MNKTRLAGFQIIIYGIDGDGGGGVFGGGMGILRGTRRKSITFYQRRS